MAKKRMLDTKYWSDTYISGLDPLEKLLFLYLITNSYTNICGIYEIPIKQIALDTGIDRENLEKTFFPRFAKAGKIHYIEGWVYVKNFIKHQKASGSIKKGIENGLENVPKEILAKVREIDTLTTDTGTTQVHHSPIFEIEIESKIESEAESPAAPAIVSEPATTPPTLQDVKDYAKQRNSPVDPEYYWEKNNVLGWVSQKTKKPISNWKSNFLVWERYEKERLENNGGTFNDLSRDQQLKYQQFHRVIQALEAFDGFELLEYENNSLTQVSKDINTHLYGETQVPAKVINWINDNNFLKFMLGKYKTLKNL